MNALRPPLPELTERTPVRLTVVVLIALLCGVFGVAGGVYAARDRVMKDVREVVREAVAQETSVRTREGQHYVTREELQGTLTAIEVRLARIEERIGNRK